MRRCGGLRSRGNLGWIIAVERHFNPALHGAIVANFIGTKGMGPDGERGETGKGPGSLIIDKGQAIGIVVDIELNFAAGRTTAAKYNVPRLVIINRIEVDGPGRR